VIALYLFVNAAYFYVLTPVEVASVAESSSVAGEAASRFFGPAAAAIISAGLMISAYGTLHTTLLTGPRIPYALAQAGMLPAGLARISSQGVPAVAVLTIGIWSIVLSISGTFDILTDMYIFILWIFFGLSAGAVLVLRRTRPDAERPYKVWGYPDALEPTFENKAPVAIWSQHQHMLIDSLPLCDFAFPQLIRPMNNLETWRNTEDIAGDLELDLRLFAAVTGEEKTHEEMERAAERAFTLERAMLARARRDRKMEEAVLAPHFELPCRADGTLIDNEGFTGLLDEYYSARGWDLELGWPQAQQLRELGLEDVVPAMDTYRQNK